MADKTGIEWTDATWNPTTGCDRISPGCDNCYALTLAKRLKAMGSAKYQTDGDPRTSGPGFGVATHADALDDPLHWRKPRRVFVNSMSDLFHAKVPVEFIAEVFARMWWTPRHTFQVLTKRPVRMRLLMPMIERKLRQIEHDLELVYCPTPLTWPLPNVWLGVSVEDQKQADIRIPKLLDTPAAVRFLSCEPLLGPVDLSWVAGIDVLRQDWIGGVGGGSGAPHPFVDWVIAGGESGPDARPMHPDWARSLRDQCQAAGVPFLFKQWGEWGPAPWVVRVCDPAVGWKGTAAELVTAKADAEARGATHVVNGEHLYEPTHKPWSLERVGDQAGAVRRWGKHRAGRELDGRTWDEYPPANVAGGTDV